MASAPGFRATNHFALLHREFMGAQWYPRPAPRFDGHLLDLYRPAPVFDQDTRAVLRDLGGLSEEEIDDFYARGVCATVPRGWG